MVNFGSFKGKITVFLQKLNWLIQYLLKLNKNCRCAQFWLMPLILLRFYAGRLCVYESAPGTSSFQAWHYPYCGHDLLLEKVAALIKVAFWLQVAYRHSRHEFLQVKRGPSDPLWIWIWNKFKVQFPMFKIVCRIQIKFVISLLQFYSEVWIRNQFSAKQTSRGSNLRFRFLYKQSLRLVGVTLKSVVT